MKNRTIRFAQLAVALTLAIGSASAVGAAPPPNYTTHNATSTTLRDAFGDVVVSDGSGPYVAGAGLISYVRDFGQSKPDFDSETLTQDFFYFSTASTGGARSGSMTSRLAILTELGPAATEPIPCQSIYAYFESNSTPDWYEALTVAGSSVTGFATTGCYSGTDRGYHVAYPSDHPSQLGECVTMSRLDATHERMTASPACGARVYSFTTIDGEKQFTSLGFEAAPLEITLDFTQFDVGGKGSKGKGKGGSK